MAQKNSLADYTEAEFIELIHAITDCVSEEERDALLDQWDHVVHHPSGTDLLYYPEDGADDSPEGIAATVKAWCASNGLPSFKNG